MSAWNSTPLKPETEEDAKIVETCDGKRAALERYAYDDALTRQVFRQAAYLGFSGEDKYVTLAYHALLSLEQTRDRLLRTLELTPMPPFVFAPGSTIAELEKDATRYRYMRAHFQYGLHGQHRLEWYLPMMYGKSLRDQLDEHIDEAIASKS